MLQHALPLPMLTICMLSAAAIVLALASIGAGVQLSARYRPGGFLYKFAPGGSFAWQVRICAQIRPENSLRGRTAHRGGCLELGIANNFLLRGHFPDIFRPMKPPCFS